MFSYRKRALLLIVGLGNPGTEYAGTRHNVGFMFVERLAERHGIRCSMRSAESFWGRGRVCGEPVVLVKPQTFMNLSGRAVAAFSRKFDVPIGSVIVAYDDCDLPLGTLRLKPRGGSGGHRGLASVIESLGSRDFPRLRLGIGRPARGDLTSHVLGPFRKAEREALEDMLERAVTSVEVLIEEGIESAMNRFN